MGLEEYHKTHGSVINSKTLNFFLMIGKKSFNNHAKGILFLIFIVLI